jgi:hypothetical protein
MDFAFICILRDECTRGARALLLLTGQFVTSLVSLPLASHFLEQHWGGAELLQFSGIVIVGSNALAMVLSLLLYLLLRVRSAAFRVQFHGLEALLTGYLVAFAQLIPEHQLQFAEGRFKLRVRVRRERIRA